MEQAPGGRTGRSSIADELGTAGSRELATDRAAKKNYAEAFSNALAIKVANQLRPRFPGILPLESGAGRESRARTSRGIKKLDVNFSTPELGLGLGVSIKTVNFVDRGSSRFTKNYTRIDNELRAEAHDYHERQPFAVMIGLVFIPVEACADGESRGASSFAQAVNVFRHRAGRTTTDRQHDRFERIFLAMYAHSGARCGDVWCFDVMNKPPKRGEPIQKVNWAEAFDAITDSYDERNDPRPVWE